MNFCPPKPGSTVMTRAISMWFAQGASSSTVVPGFMAKPACRDINTAATCTHTNPWIQTKNVYFKFTGLHSATFMPLSFISLMRFPGLVVASKWKVYWLAPAAAIGFTHCSGRDTIMCMSATHTLKKWRPLSNNKWSNYMRWVLSHQRMGPDQVISSGIPPWDGQMWCLAQSDFKGKQSRLQKVVVTCTVSASLCKRTVKEKVYVELNVKRGFLLNIF